MPDSAPDPGARSVSGAAILAATRRTHPRLFTGDLAEFRAKCRTGVFARWSALLIDRAGAILDAPAPPRVRPEPWAVAPATANIEALVAAYVLSEGPRFLQRLVAELDALDEWPSWLKNPDDPYDQFIEVCDLGAVVAVAYDWCHSAFGAEQRQRYRAMLCDKLLAEGMRSFDQSRYWTLPDKTWNWVLVCNGGLAVAALAVAHDADPAQQEVAGELLSLGIDRVRRSQDAMLPDGGWFEGPGYWWFGVRALDRQIEALLSATGSSYGLAEHPAMAKTGWFAVDLTGPTGRLFNWADALDRGELGANYAALARRYGEPGLADWVRPRVDAAPELLDLAYSDPAQIPAEPRQRWTSRPAEAVYRGVQNAVARGSWADPRTAFFGVKGGQNGLPHGQLDLGDVVFDALGQRWICQLGREPYGREYWDDGADGLRWTFYRCAAEGNNTIANVVDHGGQRVGGAGIIEEFVARAERAYAIVNLDDASSALATWRRGVELGGSRRELIIRDEFSCTEPQELWWFVHTEAQVALSANRRTALLSLGGETCLARLLDGPDERFCVLPAEPLWTSPRHPDSLDNPGISRLAIRFRGVRAATPTVQFTPVPSTGAIPGPFRPGALADWNTAPPRAGEISGELPVVGPKLVAVTASLPDSLRVGDAVDLAARVTFSDGTSAELAAAEYYSARPEIAAISAGRLTAYAPGTTEVAVIADTDGHLRWARATVVVTRP